MSTNELLSLNVEDFLADVLNCYDTTTSLEQAQAAAFNVCIRKLSQGTVPLVARVVITQQTHRFQMYEQASRALAQGLKHLKVHWLLPPCCH